MFCVMTGPFLDLLLAHMLKKGKKLSQASYEMAPYDGSHKHTV